MLGWMCSKLTITTPEYVSWRHSGVFTINLEYSKQNTQHIIPVL